MQRRELNACLSGALTWEIQPEAASNGRSTYPNPLDSLHPFVNQSRSKIAVI
jgi:hypothetical protein